MGVTVHKDSLHRGAESAIINPGGEQWRCCFADGIRWGGDGPNIGWRRFVEG